MFSPIQRFSYFGLFRIDSSHPNLTLSLQLDDTLIKEIQINSSNNYVRIFDPIDTLVDKTYFKNTIANI